MPAARLLAPAPSVDASMSTTSSRPCSRRKQAHQPPTVPPPTTTASALRGSSPVGVTLRTLPETEPPVNKPRKGARPARSGGSGCESGRLRLGGDGHDDPPDAQAAGVLHDLPDELDADALALPRIVDGDLDVCRLVVVLMPDAACGADAEPVARADRDQCEVVVVVSVEAEADLRLDARAHDALLLGMAPSGGALAPLDGDDRGACAWNATDVRKRGFAPAYAALCSAAAST